jgi:hypothetical protein
VLVGRPDALDRVVVGVGRGFDGEQVELDRVDEGAEDFFLGDELRVKGAV